MTILDVIVLSSLAAFIGAFALVGFLSLLGHLGVRIGGRRGL